MYDIPFAQIVQKKASKAFDCSIPPEEKYYTHPTFVINNLPDYIRIIATISSDSKYSIYGDSVVYRGLADSEHNMLPGLARIKKREPDMESTVINDFLVRRPDAFRGMTDFDTLAKMQHYGLPTRLLDFSLNPLVALYFACESNFNKAGRVLCHNCFLQNESSDYVNALCTSAIHKTFDSAYTIEDYYCNDNLSLKKYLSETYLFDDMTVVRPKYWNQRIANQSGVFMIFPNNVIDRYRSILIHESELGIEKAIREYGRGNIDITIIQKAVDKEPIAFYKNEASSFLTDECFRKMNEAYKPDSSTDFWETVRDRFTITDTIKPLSPERISNNFCSIIIEPNKKRKILQDLSFIGFRADYIYPELEYTAKEIRRRFE